MNATAQRFEQFHADNPEVFTTLEDLVWDWINQFGYHALGIRMLWEQARWRLIVATNSPDYKLNDHYTSYYVRLLLMYHPSWNPMFELRKSPADEWALAFMKRLEKVS